MDSKTLKTLSSVVLTLALSACAGGSGGGAAVPAGANNGGSETAKALSPSLSTLSASLVYAKANEPITITLTPRAQDGSVIDLAGKYDPQVTIFCTGCQADPAKLVPHTAMTENSDVYTFTYTPDANSVVYAGVMYVGANYGNANLGVIPNVNDPSSVKLSLTAWDECYDAKPFDTEGADVWRARVISGVTYNLICDDLDIMRMYKHGADDRFIEAMLGDYYSVVYDASTILSSQRISALNASKNQGWIVMRSVTDYSKFSLSLMDNTFFNNTYTGEVYMNGKTLPIKIMGNLPAGQIKTGMPQ